MTRTKTSETNPIEIATLPAPWPGRVSLTFAPGKHAWSQEGFVWARDLSADLDRLAHVFDTQVLVCLLEDRELLSLKIPRLVKEAEARGLEVHRLPIPDGGTLPSPDDVRDLVRVIADHAKAGRNVVIHCMGGLGRAGTIGGCILVESGLVTEAALLALAKARGPRCPENDRQKDFIRAYETSRLKDRIIGTVLGAAIGDAMGHPTEFLSMENIRKTYGPKGVQKYELFIDDEGRKVAPYTDDTQLAEAVARGLLEALPQSPELDHAMKVLARRFIEWSKHPEGGHRAPGNACLSGCRALDRGVHWSEGGAPDAGGCGSVMRVYPFGILFHGDLERTEAWAVAHSKLTHRDPIALAACAAMAVGIARILLRDEVSTVVDAMIEAADRYSPRTAAMMTQALDEAHAGVPPAETLDRLRGWAAHEAIAAAVYLFVRHPDDPRAAILEAINSPGDSDSLGTLAGALVGARCGLSSLPEDWVRDLERSEALVEMARALADAVA